VLPSKYKVKEYCPQVFRSLRKRFGEDPEEFLVSVKGTERAPPRVASRGGTLGVGVWVYGSVGCV
jgi:hypothetical protein